jgi:glutamate 5-kinase (EC 2.7.2.11)
MIHRPAPSLTDAKLLVVKIGSALIVDPAAAAPRTAWLDGMAADIAQLRARGVGVIVVSSGAIALARRQLGLMQPRLRLEEKQAAASVGQIRLAQAWSEALSATGWSRRNSCSPWTTPRTAAATSTPAPPCAPCSNSARSR